MIELSNNQNSDYLKIPKRHLKGVAKWRDIEDLINRWAKRNPKGAIEQEQWLKSTKESLYDKKDAKWVQGFNQAHGHIDPETKFSLLIHPELLNYIEAFYPDLFSTKEALHEFMKRFPKFRIRQTL